MVTLYYLNMTYQHFSQINAHSLSLSPSRIRLDHDGQRRRRRHEQREQQPLKQEAPRADDTGKHSQL